MRAALAVALAAACWSVAVVVSGGFDLRPVGLPVVARTPWPTLVAAVLLLAACVASRRAAVLDDVAGVLRNLGDHAAPIALALAITSGALAIRFGTFAVGGSDSNCYVEQAERWAAGTMLEPVQPGFTADWPNAALSLTPTGFVPSRRVEGAIAPICPAGLSLIMAVPRALGAPRSSVFFVVPAFAAMAVICVFLIGRRLAGPGTGLAATLMTAASPAFLYQAVQPMSDVPATALWLASLVCVSHASPPFLVGAGLSAAAAILVRPNLAPLALVILAAAALGPWATAAPGGSARAGRSSRTPAPRAVRVGLARAALVVAGLLPGAIAVGIVQDVLYGSPFSSGYGNPGLLFRAEHVIANLSRYPRWLVETQSPFVLLGLVAPLVLWVAPGAHAAARGGTRRVLWLACTLWVFALGAFAAYLPYVPFDGWWFLRFWLPGIPPLIVLAAAAATVLVGTGRATRTSGPHRAVAAALAALLACTALAAWQLGVARDRAVFRLQRFERKFVVTGEYVAALPANAVVLAIWHGGAVNYYARRSSVAWDAIAPDGLDAVVASLRRQGRDAYLLLEPSEEHAFRKRFGADSVFARLDWPPRARFSNEATLWALGDRERFERGEATPSERVWVR